MKNNPDKIKVLEVSIVSHNTGGVEKILSDLFQHLDTERFQVDFLSPEGGSYDVYRSRIEERGGRILDLNVDRTKFTGKIRYGRRLSAFLKSSDYDVVHVNSGAFLFCLQVAIIAKRNKTHKIISHSHNTINYGIAKRLLYGCLKPILEKKVDHMLSCSKMAARGLYTDKAINDGRVVIIKNGIEAIRFKYDPEKRVKLRRELGLEGKAVYGHIGRLTGVKNQLFLIEVFNELQKKQPDSLMLIVGDGELKDTLESRIADLGLEGKVQMLGFREDVNDLLNCFDAFLLPSIYEGLPIVAIEAQTNGLPIFCSDGVTEETKISDNFFTIPLSLTASQWADRIAKEMKNINEAGREDKYKNCIKAGYDINVVAKEIADIYQS